MTKPFVTLSATFWRYLLFCILIFIICNTKSRFWNGIHKSRQKYDQSIELQDLLTEKAHFRKRANCWAFSHQDKSQERKIAFVPRHNFFLFCFSLKKMIMDSADGKCALIYLVILCMCWKWGWRFEIFFYFPPAFVTPRKKSFKKFEPQRRGGKGEKIESESSVSSAKQKFGKFEKHVSVIVQSDTVNNAEEKQTINI